MVNHVLLQFILEDLKHDVSGSEVLHGNDDFISVHELWQLWIRSSGQ